MTNWELQGLIAKFPFLSHTHTKPEVDVVLNVDVAVDLFKKINRPISFIYSSL